jgi:glycosyltransferase involved in cell wall biosynthesis
LDISLVVPFYNPGPAVRTTVERAVAALEGADVSFEVIAVSDGSTDGSEALLADLDPGVVTTVVLPSNRGKGYAVRTGMGRASGRFVGFLDGDGDIEPELVAEFIAVALTEDPAIAFGSKRHPDSRVTVPVIRRIYTWGYRGLVRVLFHLSVTDTQTGIKLIRADALSAIGPRMVEERFAFDLELFVLARELGFDSLRELPVRMDKRSPNTISFRTTRTILWDTISIYKRYRTDRVPGSAQEIDVAAGCPPPAQRSSGRRSDDPGRS